MPASRSELAVPPVERISTPWAASVLAKSAIPVLSETEISARRTRIAPLATGSDRGSAEASVIEHDDPWIVCVDPSPTLRDHADRLRVELVLDRVDRRLQPRPVAIGGHRHLAPHDRRPGVDPLVDEVDRDAGDLDARVQRLADRVETGKGGQQRRVDVDDAAAKAGDEGGGEQLHVAGEDDEVRAPRLDPPCHRRVARLATGVLLAGKNRGLDPRLARPLQRPRVWLVGADPDHLDPLAPVQRVEDRLQIGAAPRSQDDDSKAIVAHAFVLCVAMWDKGRTRYRVTAICSSA